jgi:hypothetical protein
MKPPTSGPVKRSSNCSAGDAILLPARFSQLEQVLVPMPAPVDDVVAAVIPDLRFQARARHPVRQEVGHHPALRVDFPLEEPQQVQPLLPGPQRA